MPNRRALGRGLSMGCARKSNRYSPAKVSRQKLLAEIPTNPKQECIYSRNSVNSGFRIKKTYLPRHNCIHHFGSNPLPRIGAPKNIASSVVSISSSISSVVVTVVSLELSGTSLGTKYMLLAWPVGSFSG